MNLNNNDFITIGNKDESDLIIIWFHGYGSNNWSFEPTLKVINMQMNEAAYIIMPNAPLVNDKRSWYPLPFKDKEFDFVICSHVLEHVEDISFLIMELQRIANQGYIELPTRLEDNLVFENKNDHIWSMSYNDEKNLLLISKRQQIIEPILTVSSIKNLNKYFRDSFVIEIHWYKDINFKIVDNNLEFKKISRLKLFKKFFSKNIRSMFKKKN